MSQRENYSGVAITIHWATALFVVANLVLGHVMEGAPMKIRFVLIMLHVWIGLTVLLLTVLRIVWRIRYPKPPYPLSIKTWEVRLASLVQVAFYLLMVAMPVLGYFILSANPPNPMWHLTFWGVVPLPFLGYLQNLDRPEQIVAHGQFVAAHALGGWLMVGTLTLHLAGVVKHIVVDKVNIIKRMWPSG